MPITQSFQRDANSVPITGLGLVASKDIIYSTLTTGATGATTLFTVTGLVAMRVWAVCSTDLTGANATLEVGIANNTASIITTTTGTTIDAGEIWTATNPPSVVALPDLLLINGTDVIQTIAVAAVSGGELTYYCAWFPLTPSATVVAAQTMANARKDQNGANCWLGVSCVDGVTLVPIMIDTAAGGVRVDDSTVISFTPNPNQALLRDENNVPVMKGVSSADPSVLLPIYVNPATGAILIST